jgi:hypothetical protein
MKIIITENQLRKVQFKYLDYLFEGIYEVESKKYPDSRFWKKDGKVVLELEIYGELYVSRPIWNDISNMISLDFDKTQQLIREWVEQRLGLEEVTPFHSKFSDTYLLERHLI